MIPYLLRFLQVCSVMLRQTARFGWRKLRRRPAEGPELVREGFEQLSGSFVKFGQILSLQIDTLPREYCDSLLALLDRVPPFPAAEVDDVFRQELRAAPRDLYAEFEYKPVASASIGQVHRARLQDGTAVAVKVQRPGVRLSFERDLLLFQVFVKLIFFFRIRRLYFMRDPVRELATWTQDELDYRREAAYCKLLGENAVQTPSERVPNVHWKFTTGRILTMDFLEGPSVATYLRWVESGQQDKLDAMRRQGFDPAVFSNNVISNFLSDAFRFGVFHADLHPANLLILPNNVVGYVDFGIVAVLTPEARRKQIELTLAYSTGDPQDIYDGFLNICMIDDGADLPGLRRRIEQFTKIWYQEPAIGGRVRFKVTVTQTMMDLLSICQDYGVLVDREMIKYIRSTILADGLVTRLAPGFDLAHTLRKVVEDYLEEEGRKRVFSAGAALSFVTDLALWMQSGPAAFLHALNLFERGQLRIRAQMESAPDSGAPIRAQLISSAVLWALAVFLFGFLGAFPDWRQSPVFATLAGLFVASLTVRLVLLYRRLTVR